MFRNLAIISGLISGIFTHVVIAEESAAYQMQYRHLMNPSDTTLKREEERQSVYIYEGMRIADVDKAMDSQFDRVENMMFVQTRVPVKTGEEGAETTQKDGCD
jgi:hypothetical protein